MTTVTDPLTAALTDTRERTLTLVGELEPAALEAVHSPLMSPLVWDLGHIAAFEDLWVSRTFATPMLAPEMVRVYDADETPRADRGTLPFLRPAEARDYLERTRAHTLALLAAHEAPADPADQTDRTDHADGPDQDLISRRLELIVRHELQHNETMLQTLQIAHLPAGIDGALPRHGDPTWIRVEAGEQLIGADPADGFAYDNEQPRHRRHLPAFELAAAPVTNGQWQAFIDAGGYGRRDNWSEQGWAWRDAEAVQRPLHWTDDGRQWRFERAVPIDPAEPVIHISHFEAEAFARQQGSRLPSEFELEVAAPNLGAVWEWTSTEFHGYVGFRPDPYPEYSQQFFGHGYRVLRGGSWLSSPRVATPQFRNWDHPQRRQIFSGMRLARDL